MYPEISGFSTAHSHKYKTKRQKAKMKRKQKLTSVFFQRAERNLYPNIMLFISFKRLPNVLKFICLIMLNNDMKTYKNKNRSTQHFESRPNGYTDFKNR